MMSMVFMVLKRIAAILKEDPAYTPVNHNKVARIMKAMGLKGLSTRRRCITTKRKPGHRVMPDLVGRTFTANEPNRVYVGDITYLPCKSGKNMYLATVIDAYSRKLVGHALADHMRVFLVIEALSHARKVRGSLGGTFFILITAVCTPHRRFEITARRWVCANPWVRWELVLIMP